MLAPGEIVVVVNLFENLRFEHPRNPGAYPVAARIGVQAAKAHAFEILRSQIGVHGQDARIDIHSVGGTRGFQEPGRSFYGPSHANRNSVHTAVGL